MKKHRNFKFALLSGLALSLAGVLVAQSAPEKTLIVNGKSAGAVVRVIPKRTNQVRRLAESLGRIFQISYPGPLNPPSPMTRHT